MTKLIAVAAMIAAAILSYAVGTAHLSVPFNVTWCLALPTVTGLAEHRICVDHQFIVRLD